jgi:hypothetical protein
MFTTRLAANTYFSIHGELKCVCEEIEQYCCEPILINSQVLWKLDAEISLNMSVLDLCLVFHNLHKVEYSLPDVDFLYV